MKINSKKLLQLLLSKDPKVKELLSSCPRQIDFQLLLSKSKALAKLSSEQAADLGFGYGKYYLLHRLGELEEELPALTLHQDGNNQYIIQMITRWNEVVIFNTRTLELYTLSPFQVLQSKEIIMHFSASQAFYMGFLAAISVDKGQLN